MLFNSLAFFVFFAVVMSFLFIFKNQKGKFTNSKLFLLRLLGLAFSFANSVVDLC
jgi:hypothetical protein